MLTDSQPNAVFAVARSVTPQPGPADESINTALANLSPRTAAQIREAAEKRAEEERTGKTKSRKQIVDSITELPESQVAGGLSQGLTQGAAAAGRRGVENILTEVSRTLCVDLGKNPMLMDLFYVTLAP